MTDEQKLVLAELKDRENILSFNYWENFKYHKEMAQGLGGTNPKVKRIGENCERIRIDLNAAQENVRVFLESLKKEETA